MRLATFLWATGFLVVGILAAVGVVGSSWDDGPRYGAATLLVMCGLLLGITPLSMAILRRRTGPEDLKGGCPVGTTCACGHFNFKPRAKCKQCGLATHFA